MCVLICIQHSGSTVTVHIHFSDLYKQGNKIHAYTHAWAHCVLPYIDYQELTTNRNTDALTNLDPVQMLCCCCVQLDI